MSRVVIKKKIPLDFLGEEYKEAYVVLKAITLREADELSEAGKDSSKATEFLKKVINDKFVEGKFPDEKGELFALTNDDLMDFDVEAIGTIFQRLTGQEVDPNLVKP